MRTKTVGTIVGSLGLLLAARSVKASDESPAPTTSGVPEVTGSQIVNEMSGKPVCRDAGVTVSFTTASSDLDTNAKGALNGVVTWMKANPDRTLHLQGYADTTGNSEANLVLSEHRADAVKAYLTAQGVAPERIITAGRGEIADHLPASGRTVTFLACEPAAPGPTATAEPEAQPEAIEPVAPAPALSPIGDVPPSPTADQGEEYKPYGSKFGWAFLAGGGYQDFTNDTMRNQTQGGGAWSARVVGGTRSYVGFEAAYVGSAQRIQPLGVSTNSNLVSNGGEGALRINVPIMVKDSLLEPYGFVGLGWSRYQISNYNQFVTSDFTRSDDVMTVPIGTGFAYGYKAFMVDARASWTPTYYNNLLLGTTNTSGTLNHWGVGGQVGFAF
jgi:hypothetical protein